MMALKPSCKPNSQLRDSKESAKFPGDNYTGCINKTEQILNCSQFGKTTISIQFLIYIASLGTSNVE